MGYVDVVTDRKIAYYYNIQQLPTIVTIIGGFGKYMGKMLKIKANRGVYGRSECRGHC